MASERGRELVRYVIDGNDRVTHGIIAPGAELLPQFEPGRIRGTNYVDVVPAESRERVRLAIAETRATTRVTVVRCRRVVPPYPERLVYCAPGRREGDVMIYVYEPVAAKTTDRPTDRARRVPGRKG